MNYYILTYETNNELVNESYLYSKESDDSIDNRWKERAFEIALDRYFDIYDGEAENLEIFASNTAISKDDYTMYRIDGLKKIRVFIKNFIVSLHVRPLPNQPTGLNPYFTCLISKPLFNAHPTMRLIR